MNVLILTPDRVGSTLLQRLITIYMLRKGFDQPVINLHELTNGIVRYYNSALDNWVLGNSNQINEKWGYFQSLPEIIDQLASVDHYKTSRLAKYHIDKRQDSISDQLNFYDYLNKNFYIIGGRRDNLFEHALSWEVVAHSKQLNVYDIESKISVFTDIYKNKITATKESFITHLTRYKEYIEWSDRYFNVQSYFNYDRDIQNIEQYILNLDFMAGHHSNTWKDMFDQDFNTWNTCHRLIPNAIIQNTTSSISKELTVVDTENKWDLLKGSDWPNLSSDFSLQENKISLDIKKEIQRKIKIRSFTVTEDQYIFLKNNIDNYVSTNNEISKLVANGFLVTPIPIKLQSLAEKRSIVKNFDECLTWYNEWVEKNNFGSLYTDIQIQAMSEIEGSRLQSLLQLSLQDH
jgi:hypothetical protein